MRFDPFKSLSCTYGAPMGRISRNIDIDSSLCARHQNGGDGYDKGGAYWGTPSNVWAVWAWGKGSNGVQYVRANSRQAAIDQVKGGSI